MEPTGPTVCEAKVYVETTIVSYLVASPTQDIVQAAHQQITREWWSRRERFDLFVSRPVLAEAGHGDVEAAARRLEALAGIPVLTVARGVGAFANALLRTRTLPEKARLDAVHIAVTQRPTVKGSRRKRTMRQTSAQK